MVLVCFIMACFVWQLFEMFWAEMLGISELV